MVSLWLAASAGAAALAITSGKTVLSGGAAFGAAAGILFSAGDVATKAAVSGRDHPVVAPAILAFYAGATVVLQLGFQRGGALTTAGIATLGTNAIPIAAAMTLFAEPLPEGVLGVIRWFPSRQPSPAPSLSRQGALHRQSAGCDRPP